MATMGYVPPGSTWQQFYVPMTNNDYVGGGFSDEYIAQENANRLREAQLAAQQLQQAENVTTSQQMSLQQQSQNQEYLNQLRGTLQPSKPTVQTSSPYNSLPMPPSGYSPAGNIGTSGTGSVSVMGPSNVATVTGGINLGGTQTQAEQQRYDPWSDYRGRAAEVLGETIGSTSPSDIYQQRLAEMASGVFSSNDPSYQWRFDQGQQAVERSLAAKGLLNSGNAAIELQQYGQGAASQEYQAQFNRLLQGMTGVEDVYNTQMNRLMQMAGVGIDPTAGGRLNVEQGQLGVAQGQLGVQAGQLGLNAQQQANDWYLRNRELGLKEQLAYQSMLTGGVGGMGGTNWSAIFGS